jgi:hypothetical protein
MDTGKGMTRGRGLISWAAIFCAITMIASPARAAFHFWNLNELYTNSSGTLQFIEMQTTSSLQDQLAGQHISVSNGTTNTFNITSNLSSSNTANHFLLFGTAGIQAAGGPAPDFIIPNGFLFSSGGTISFFGAGGGYTPTVYFALPTDGTMSRIWGGTSNNAVNSPTNFNGQSGTVVVPAPEPTSVILAPLAIGVYGFCRRLSRRRNAEPSNQT